MEVLFYMSGVVILFNSILSYYKFLKKKDFGYLGMSISRLVVVGIMVYHGLMREHLSHEDFLLILFILAISEFINFLIYVFSKKYIVRIERNEMRESVVKNYALDSVQGNVGFFIISEKGFVEYSNKPLLDILGYEKQELMEKNILDLVHIEDRHIVSKEIKAKLEGKKDLSIYDFRIIDKKGDTKNVRVISSIITNGHVSIAGSLFLKED